MYRRVTGETDRVVIHREEKMSFYKSGAGVQGCSPGVVELHGGTVFTTVLC
jgi:hypothetical protein